MSQLRDKCAAHPPPSLRPTIPGDALRARCHRAVGYKGPLDTSSQWIQMASPSRRRGASRIRRRPAGGVFLWTGAAAYSAESVE